MAKFEQKLTTTLNLTVNEGNAITLEVGERDVIVTVTEAS